MYDLQTKLGGNDLIKRKKITNHLKTSLLPGYLLTLMLLKVACCNPIAKYDGLINKRGQTLPLTTYRMIC